MELLGLQKCFSYLEKEKLEVSNFISDRHRGVAKWFRELFPSVNHYFDIWHVACIITKKLLKAGKEKDWERNVIHSKPFVLVCNILKGRFQSTDPCKMDFIDGKYKVSTILILTVSSKLYT